MAVAAFHPEIQQKLGHSIQSGIRDSLPGIARAYSNGNVISAAAWTFVVNSALGALVTISLPGLIVPFSGMLMTALRMILWGLVLSPTSHTLRVVMLPHSLTLLIEGQAYILAAFGSYLLGKWTLFPRTAGLSSHREGYVAGLKLNAALYLLILPILAAAAVYEAVEVQIVRHLLAP
jgi:hypothetical protein